MHVSAGDSTAVIADHVSLLARVCGAVDLHYQPMLDPLEQQLEDAVLEAASQAAATSGKQHLTYCTVCTSVPASAACDAYKTCRLFVWLQVSSCKRGRGGVRLYMIQTTSSNGFQSALLLVSSCLPRRLSQRWSVTGRALLRCRPS